MDNPLDDRRSGLRFELACDTVCQIEALENDHVAMTGQVWDVSMTGLSMLTPSCPVAGKELSATLLAEKSGVRVPVVLVVQHVTPFSSGGFLVGARFPIPLPIDVVDSLVTRPQ